MTQAIVKNVIATLINCSEFPCPTIVGTMGRARLARVCDLSSIGLAIAAALLVISFGRFLSLASDAAYDHIEVQQRTEHQAIGRRWEPSSTAHPIRQRLTLATSQDVSCEPQTIPLVGSIQLLPDIHCGMAPQPLCVPLVRPRGLLPLVVVPWHVAQTTGKGCLQRGVPPAAARHCLPPP